jgi:hypothetical protein
VQGTDAIRNLKSLSPAKAPLSPCSEDRRVLHFQHIPRMPFWPTPYLTWSASCAPPIASICAASATGPPPPWFSVWVSIPGPTPTARAGSTSAVLRAGCRHPGGVAVGMPRTSGQRERRPEQERGGADIHQANVEAVEPLGAATGAMGISQQL